MEISYTRGVVTKQAHVGIPDGLFEEEYGRSGFFGGYAHIYRKKPPVNWLRIEGPLKPRSFQLKIFIKKNSRVTISAIAKKFFITKMFDFIFAN